MSSVDPPRSFALYARGVMLSTVLLIFVGALVTTLGAGLSVPDWPLSFGRLNPAMVGGVAYEHGHRMVASAVGLLVAILAGWAYFGGYDRRVRQLCWLSLALVVIQGLLGGMTVLLRLPRPVSVAHATMAQLFLCALVAVVLYTSRSFRQARVGLVGDRASALRLTAMLAVATVLVQLIVAATMRHMGAGLVIGDFPTNLGYIIPPFTSKEVIINFTHRVMALLVLLVLSLFAWRVQRERAHLNPRLLWLTRAMVGLVLVQIGLGAMTVWSGRGVVPTCAHVMNGALVLATTWASCLWVLRTTAHFQPAEMSERAEQPRGDAPRDYMDLFKVKLVLMSVLMAALSYWTARGSFELMGLLQVSLGVGLIGAGASALNQLLETETDRAMTRTCRRPVLCGRISAGEAEFWGCGLSIAGTLYLGVTLHPLAGLLAALAVVTYAFVYTPLKRVSAYCTVIGAIPGALPVLVGWSAATGGLEVQGWVLFFILFLWQLPHFIAIAWLCKEDYARARLPMVTVLDPSGNLAAGQAIAYCLALLPVSLAPALCGLAGGAYFCVALVLGLGYLYAGILWGQRRTMVAARQLLLVSVAYLPLLFGALAVS